MAQTAIDPKSRVAEGLQATYIALNLVHATIQLHSTNITLMFGLQNVGIAVVIDIVIW